MSSRNSRFYALVLLSGVFVVSQAAPVSDRTWRTLDEMAQTERDILDFRSDSQRDAEIPYLPAERYPFEPPYTAEEVAYRMMHFTRAARWSHIYAAVFGIITKSGYLTENVTVSLINQIGDDGAVGHIYGKPGDAYSRQAYYYTYPAKDKGSQLMWTIRRSGPNQSTKLDNFVYSPAMRRVRRQPPPRRDVHYPDSVPSFDDIIGREAWEYFWRFIGTDVIYETVRFPKTRPTITLANADGSFYEKSTGEIKMMGDSYPYYRSDGGIDCLVVVAEPNRDWLPDYNVAKLIYWVDKHYFYPLRIEQYDAEDMLKKVEVRMAKRRNSDLPDGEGYENNQAVYHDTELDLISYSVHDTLMLHAWSDEEQKFFTPDFMRRRWLMYPRKSQALIHDPKTFYLRPHLLVDRFPKERSIQLSPEIEARIAAQDAAGHLVFAGPE